MIAEVSMKPDMDRFSVNSWWATSPDFVLGALMRQLHVAQTIWPQELGQYAIVKVPDPVPPPNLDEHVVQKETP